MFDIAIFSRISSPGATLTVYIEGDGAAWFSRNRLSPDPTPRNPLVLQLALFDPSPNIVYMARPCQYVFKTGKARNCQPAHWSSHRFSEEMIAAADQTLSILKEKTRAKEIHLVGYSGGGAVAVLVAARRNDIRTIRTIAGNLDHKEFCLHHKVTPLWGSLNAFDAAESIKHIPQIHFAGEGDRTVPAAIARSFVHAQFPPECSEVVSVRGASHDDGWRQQWPSLLQVAFPCAQALEQKRKEDNSVLHPR
ncbi:MAG: alpha/beta hydrolase [Pseudomonadota bacterium]